MNQLLFSRSIIADEMPLPEVTSRVEEAFVAKARDQVQMPSKLYLFFEEYSGDLRTMPAYIPAFELSTVKIVNAHPDNPAEHDLPTVMALIVAVDPETGRPKAILDGTEITALRTAAASALSTRLFAPDNSKTLGLIGAGEQSYYQVEGQLGEVSFREILVYDKNRDNASDLQNWIQENYPSTTAKLAREPEILLRDCDVINSLTPVTSPLVSSLESCDKPLLINAMGADSHEKQEWPSTIQDYFRLVVDDWEQASHSGEISGLVESGQLAKNDIWGTLGQFLDSPPDSTPERILFDSTGLAIQDTAATHAVLQSDIAADDQFDFLSLD